MYFIMRVSKVLRKRRMVVATVMHTLESERAAMLLLLSYVRKPGTVLLAETTTGESRPQATGAALVGDVPLPASLRGYMVVPPTPAGD